MPGHHEVVIVGSGFAGLGSAIALRRAGIDDFAVLEKADALGGTWRDNRYPGCACDVPTPYYSFSFAPKPDGSRFYAPYHEIRAYMEDCADRFGVRGHLCLGHEVIGMAWDDDAQRWEVEIAGRPPVTAGAVIAAPGGLARPAYPDLDGLGAFAGPWSHSADWDHQSVVLRPCSSRYQLEQPPRSQTVRCERRSIHALKRRCASTVGSTAAAPRERRRCSRPTPSTSLAFRRALRTVDDREFRFEPRRRPVAEPATAPATEARA